MEKSGIMSVIMNYYRNINRDEVQFYFLHIDDSDNETFENEIINLGGRVTKITSPKVSYKRFQKEFDLFCKQNYGKFCVVHVHDVSMAFFYRNIKKKIGANNLIYHSHNSLFSDTKVKSIRNRILALPSLWEADCYMACSDEAGIAIFNSQYNNRGILLKNAIDLNKYCVMQKEREKIRKQLDLENIEIKVRRKNE